MNKLQFLTELDQHLNRLQKEERTKFLTFYDEMISDYIESGMKEVDAVSKVGIPSAIAKELLAEADTVTLPLPKINNKYLLATIVILGFPLWGTLLLAAVLTVLCIYLALLCLPFAAGLVAFSFLVASLVSILGSPFIMAEGFWVGLTQLGLGIGSLGISALAAYLTIDLAKGVVSPIKKFNAYLYRIVKGVTRHEN
jgi:uncharacterized membrane protein